MSKIIRFTQQMLEQAKAEFEAEMRTAKLVNGTVSFKKTFTTDNAKATLRFTELAWCKMKALVAEQSKEVAWHGVAERCDDNVYLISDILVYPQSVTGATIDMDTEGYAKWIQNGISSGDERFNHLHSQGHSHVEMAVTPSPTDLDHQKEILSMVRDTGFYIFMIWNKKNDHNVWVYDLGKNILFENADVTIEIVETPNGVVQFLRDASSMVKTYAPVTKFSGGSSYYNGGYSGSRYHDDGYFTGKPAQPGKSIAVTGGGKTESETQKKKVTAHVDRSRSFDDDTDDPNGPFYYNDRYYGGYYEME